MSPPPERATGGKRGGHGAKRPVPAHAACARRRFLQHKTQTNFSVNIPAAPLKGLVWGLSFTLSEPEGLPRRPQHPVSQFPRRPRGGFTELPGRRVSARLPRCPRAPPCGSQSQEAAARLLQLQGWRGSWEPRQQRPGSTVGAQPQPQEMERDPRVRKGARAGGEQRTKGLKPTGDAGPTRRLVGVHRPTPHPPTSPTGGAPRQDPREREAPATSTRQKRLPHGVMEPSPRGNTSQLPRQRDTPEPSCCAEACKHRTTQHGVSSRWGPRAREGHDAARRGREALPVPRRGGDGAQAPESPLQGSGRSKGTTALESRGRPLAPEGGCEDKGVGLHPFSGCHEPSSISPCSLDLTSRRERSWGSRGL